MEVIEEVKEVLVSQLAVKPELVKPESKLIDDLGADSLDAMEIVSALEEKFGISVPEGEAASILLVSDIVEIINRKLKSKTISQS